MAAGVPVVASRVGGVPEMLEQGNCGLLVDPGESWQLAEAISRALTDAALRKKMCEAARAAAEARFRPRVVASQTLAAYETIGREPN
jgi:glycosyltransferase involved in cell wall biosynthesis